MRNRSGLREGAGTRARAGGQESGVSMPELGEVAHATSLLRRFLLGKTIKAIKANVDEIVFVKPLSSDIFEQLAGSKVTDVGRQGKYFWFECDKKTVVLHFGMTGWIHVKDIRTHFIAMESGGDKKQAERVKEMLAKGEDPKQLYLHDVPSEVWPPKFTKFVLTTDDDREIAFTDARRLGRIRLFDDDKDAVFKLEPLSKLGNDFSQDPLDLETVSAAISKRKVPIKSLLMDQTVFSGIGNWMADEVLYQARLHPEQYSNTLSPDHLSQLYEKLLEVCKISVETEGNTAAFPEDWLMLHRWGKARKKSEAKTNDGYTVKHVTVGGRTSCYVPELQVLIRGAVDVDSQAASEKLGDPDEPKPKRRKAAGSKKTTRVKQEVKQEEN